MSGRFPVRTERYPTAMSNTDNHDRITSQSYDRTDTVSDVAETDQDIQTDSDQSQNN